MKPVSYSMTVASTLVLGICSARAAGVAALKEQIFHDDSSASAVVFTRILDSDGPYLRIVSGTKDIDILRSNLVGRIELPNEIPASIKKENDMAPLRDTLADVNKFMIRYPKSAPLLKKQAAALADHISCFEAGEVRFEGRWISKNELVEIEGARSREFEARERIEVEKRIFEAAQRDQGLTLHDGKWVTKQQLEKLPPGLATTLSESIAPLWNGDLQGAKFAVQNLTDLASRQTGAPKVRTERLCAVVRNLYFAEVRLNQGIITNIGNFQEAAKHDTNAQQWLVPNAFGTVRKEESRKSREMATQIRQHSASLLAQYKQELKDQLQEADVVTGDFHQLKEYIVVLILAQAVRAVSSRHFTPTEFRSSFPESSRVAVREQIIRDQNSATTP